MSPHDPRRDEQRLAELLSDAVTGIEPREGLEAIRSRTHSPEKASPMSPRPRSRRPWTYAVGGAVAATAVLIAAVAVAGDRLGLTGDDGRTPAAASRNDHRSPGGAKSQGSDEGTAVPSESPSKAPGVATPAQTLAAYYLGDTPQGPRLYREFRHLSGQTPLDGALTLLQSPPQDPDYSTPWQDGSFVGVGETADAITVDLGRGSLQERPAGMDERTAREAVQQVVYTLQAADQSRTPVRFLLDDEPVDHVLGVPSSGPVDNAPQLDVLALVSISDPAEGASVRGSFTASGVASSFEATVPWEIRQDGEVVKKGFTTAEGWMDKLYPWQAKVSVDGLEAGTYTFAALTDDPSGGEGGGEGGGPQEDTRTITVR